MTPAICCPRCHDAIPATPPAERPCPRCGLVLRGSPVGVSYEQARLLQAAFPARFRLYRALCNNGFVSYHELAAGSVSLPGREDVAEFGRFLSHHAGNGEWLLDVGCGPLPVPGYLEPLRGRGLRFLGLDIYPTSFDGFRITGCAEFLPLADRSIDVVVFGTSLDHVCDLTQTLQEMSRILRRGGRCCIWMGDRRPYWREFFFPDAPATVVVRRIFGGFPKRVLRNVLNGHRPFYGILHHFRHGRYWEYENGSTFYCPPGAIDPFHMYFERPAEVIRLAKRFGFAATATERASNGVFLGLTRS
ncbi:MAG: methyltransferase domain-containing protein [Opitutaceae bacterium]|nr:methyltransferase domain-containing protein [Opitutaceae bacterium]